ncbi:PLP-dependent aminotransferase family protein [Rossellomorea aquimaris]|uniref:aminotransferase-like domain-containing protein n=1 Tax=Rossellomorea aquimaris TaxID=189382 RepID=UPI001CD44685|nr:PLP-dependent aminotransferase family protein [Rossellomorea aquimaris]MCA1054972.1 PLP-dependent aminotransferase family protein [Rossellomorea aquimaris]
MKPESYFSKEIKPALENEPPGEWLPKIPDGCIRLSSGYPDRGLVPVDGVKEAVAELLDEEKDLPFHYIGSRKMEELSVFLQQLMNGCSVSVNDEEMLITSGACQAIDLIARVLVDDETVVALESPTYMEALEIFQNYTKHFISVEVDEHGLRTDRLEEVLKDRRRNGETLPKVLYTIPSFQNPTGTTMTEERRDHIIRLAEEYDFLIIEDDAYGNVYFEKGMVPLKSRGGDRVLYVGSLSKVVAPGLRIGWIAARPEFIRALSWFKKDLGHPFAQASVAAFLGMSDLDGHFASLRKVYKEKCRLMLSELKRELPSEVSWYVPEGGYFVWVRVPGVDTSGMLPAALSEGVSYVPGKYFFLDREEGIEYLRLSFSYASKQDIVEGVQRLGRVVEAAVGFEGGK